jgi:Ca2+-binding RTX toxin-like protein
MFEIIFTSGNGDTILQDDEFQAGNYGFSGTGAAANTTLTLNLDGTLFTVTTNGAGEFTLDPTAVATGGTLNGQTLAAVMATLGEGPVSLFETVSNAFVAFTVDRQAPNIPAITAPDAQNFGFDTTGNVITGLSVSDADTATLTITLTVQGALTLAQTTGLTFTTGDCTDDSTMTFSGTVADINAAIATLGYAPANGDRDGDQLDIRVDDGTAPIVTPGVFPASFNLSSLDGTNGFVMNGVAAGDYTARSVSSAGDVNGDGIDDLLINAERVSVGGTANVGATYIVFGRDTAVDGNFAASLDLSSLDGSNGFVINGPAGEFITSEDVSSAGDLNGDGIDDLLIGAHQADPGDVNSVGEAYVVFGRNTAADGNFAASLDLSSLDGTNGFIINGIDESDRAGFAISAAGDVNGDGHDDIIVAGYLGDPNGVMSAGETFIIFGRDTAADGDFASSFNLSSVDGTNGFVINGIDANDFAGVAVSAAGDVNNDGVDDILIGAWNAEPGGLDTAGEGYVVFGSATIAEQFASESVAINLSNTAPTVSAPVVLTAIAEDSTAITITLTQLLANAADANSDALSVLGLTASSGTLVDNMDDTWSFTPAANDDTNVTFIYSVSDNVAPSVPTTATLDLTPVNDTPIVSAPVVLAAVAEDGGAITITLAQLLGNAADVEGDTLSVTGLAASSGTLVDNMDDTWTFTPAQDDDTAVTFTYSVTDNVAVPVATTATLDLTPVNDTPVVPVPAVLRAIAEDNGPITITLAHLLSHTTDVDGDTLSVIGLTASSGALVDNMDNTWSFTPAANDNTFVTFTYSVTDNVAAPVATSATLDLTPVNDLPTITAPGAQSFGFDTTGNQITGLSVGDVDTGTLTITLTVQGALTLAQTTGLTFSAGDGADDSTMTFSGTVANINAAIATLGYAPANGDRDGDQLDIQVGDGGILITQGAFPASLELSALDGTNGFVINGVDAPDQSGRSVSSAGDVNGDGIDDVLIGAYGAAPGGNSVAGESYIVFGRDTSVDGAFAASFELSALDGANGFVINGIDADDRSGWSVSSAGDVNGDGVDDVLIGAYGASGSSGETYVVFGRDTASDGAFAASFELSALDGTNGFVINGIDASDFSGYSVSSAGDVNGDGIDDLLIGAYLADPGGDSNAGETYVVFGRDTASNGAFAASLDLSALDGTTGFVINGIDASDLSGFSVSSAGDVNGDGVDDLLIGAYAADPGGDITAGETYVVFGRNTAAKGAFASSFELSSLDGTNGFVINGVGIIDQSGYSVSSAGDVNGDGVDDILIGAFRGDPDGANDGGETYIVFGRDTASDGAFASSFELSALDGTNGFLINGIDTDDYSGFSVSSLGDVNGDGVDDILIGAYQAAPGGDSSAGESYVVFGRDTASDGAFAASLDLSALDGTNGFIINGINANDRSGYSVSSAGDVNGDGVNDLLIGAYGAGPTAGSFAGETYVVFGSATIAEQFTNQSVTINLSNTAPTVSAPVVLTAIAEDSAAITITLAQLLANAADANGDTLSVTALTASSGTLVDNMDDTWTFTPADDDDTGVTFNYNVTDGEAPVVATTATLDLTPVNDAPTVTGSVVLTAREEDSGVVIITLAQLLATAADVDGDTLSITGLTASSGTLVDNMDDTWTFTPVANDDTSVTFTYSVTDNDAPAVPTTATLDLTPVNDLPTVTAPGAQDFTINSTGNQITGLSVGDIDTGTLTITLTVQGSLTLAQTTGLTFTAGDGADDSTMTFSGIVADINAAIATLGYAPANGDRDGDQLDVQVSDGTVLQVAGTFAANLELSSLDGANGFVINGIDASDFSGYSVSSAGDVNGDGVDDILIGARWADPGANGFAGETYVMFGRDTAADGAFVASLELSALDGANGFVINGANAGDESGYSVSSAGDVNGDGIDDLLIGANQADPSGNNLAGETYVVFGRDTAADGAFAASLDLSALDGTNGFVINGVDSGDQSGHSVSSAGDVNGDGVDDLLIGALNADPGGDADAGETYVVFGRNTAVGGAFAASLDLSALDGTNGFVINGIDASDRSGVSVSSAGDVNGDGIDDLLIGAQGGDPSGNGKAGETYVVFGRDAAVDGAFAASLDLSTLNGTNGFVINGVDSGDTSGFSVSSAGDVNGDGVDDLLIGAYQADPSDRDRAGETYVVFGRDTAANGAFTADFDLSSLDGTNGFVMSGIDADDRSGFSVSAAGDVNGDGVDDLLIGAYNADPGGDSSAGESYVVFGSFNLAEQFMTQSITINLTNTAPIVSAPVILTAIDEDSGPVIITSAQLLGNSTDANGDALTVSNVTASSGTLVDNMDGTWTFTSVLDDDTDVTFSYTVTDGDAAPIAATATLDLLPVLDSPGDDPVTGGVGPDDVDGGDGFDTLDYLSSTTGVTVDLEAGTGSGGDAEGDTVRNVERLVGSQFDDVLTAAATGSHLYGDVGMDRLIGRAGDDYLVGGAGADEISGGDGFDTADYAGSDLGVTVDLEAGTGLGGHAEGDSLSGIERVFGSTFDDVLTASDEGSDLYGGAGDDDIIGGAGDDFLSGGAGLDTIDGGDGYDTMDYGAEIAGVMVDLDAGVDSTGDTITAVERVFGSGFSDLLVARASLTDLYGGAGDDIFVTGGGGDILDGESGFDTLDYSGHDQGAAVDLQAGTDGDNNLLFSFERIIGSSFGDNLTGADSGSQLYGEDGDDVLTGGTGNDNFYGGAGADTITGGDGFDTADYSGVSGPVTIDLAAGTGTSAEAEGDTLSAIERVIGSSFGDVLIAEAIGSDLYGAGGDDTLTGGIGDDLLVGGTGADTITGGDGFDTVDYSGAVDRMLVDLSDGTASDGDTLAGIERVFGSALDDVLIAGVADADLYGGAGDDLLITGDGADILDGGAGDDDIYFDAADAALGLISGGSGYDWVYNDNDVADTVTLTLAGTGIEAYFGSTGVDIVDGTGLTADLTLRGNGGADQLTGGSGNDYVHVTSDTVSFAGGTGYDYLIYETTDGTGLTADLTATGFEGAVGNVGNDSLDASGNIASASLYGLAGNDTLIGGTTTDYLYGGAGDDQYTGNGGTDYFYHQDTFGNDTITDFVAGTDVMVIRTDGVFSMANMVINQDGADALLTMGTNTIRLTGVDAATLTDGDFNFPAAPGAEVSEKGPEVATDEGELESGLFVMADYVDLLEVDAGATDSAAQVNLAAEFIEDSVLSYDAEAWVIDAYGMSML